MPEDTSTSAHTVHIPVMGTGFTIDTPLRVARYGISSVISLVDDVLIEQMRKYHSRRTDEPFEEVPRHSDDARAFRITSYLNLMDRLVRKQVKELQESVFEKGSEITRYYEMLPDKARIKELYREMLTISDHSLLSKTQDILRRNAVPGAIDVNIMTKLDRDNYREGQKLAPEYSDAMAALRGFAMSTLRSSIVFSAGINQQLYRYMTKFKDFFPDSQGETKKKIILKVSDYRSAEVQGRFLAKLGLWVSEFRVESGINCGGHAFASKGHLLGLVLEEFKQKRDELFDKLNTVYNKAAASQGQSPEQAPKKFRITVQGGVGTAAEHNFLLKHYAVDSVGWGTPFLLVPEATNMDEVNLGRLLTATGNDVYLSNSSPLGIPFWNLRTSSSEEARRARIEEGKPGSPCLKGFAASNTEFTTVPLCIASRAYQKKKLQELPEEGHAPQSLAAVRENILAKSCICHDLAGNATLPTGIDPDATPAVCCGPGIVDFSKIASLEEMVGHIYGRLSLLRSNERPHMFIKELGLYIDFLRAEIETISSECSARSSAYMLEMKENLLAGIDYYQTLSSQFVGEYRDKFSGELAKMQAALEELFLTERASGQ